MNARSGFLLLEIMIALSLFATVSMVIAHYYGHTASLEHQAKKYLQATTLARSILETIARDQSIQQPTSHNDFIVTINEVGQDPLVPWFKIIELKISWHLSNNKEQSLYFTSGFFMPAQSDEVSA